MKAIIYEKYGSPEVLKIADIEKPVPGKNQIQVQVKAASVNPFDWRYMRGKPFLARLDGGLWKPKNTTLGADLSGVVTEIGTGITRFKVGDFVMAEPEKGAFAEFCLVDEDAAVHKPENLSFSQAAAMPMVGLTALKGLKDYGRITSDQKVLINGASGGIGSVAVQMAKHFGARVTGVCSNRNTELVLSLGAHEVIDYTRESLQDFYQQWDLIFDTVGNIPIKEVLPLLEKGGTAVIAGFTTMGNMLPYMMKKGKTLKGDKGVEVVEYKVNGEDLNRLAELLKAESVKAVLDKSFSLDQVPEAIAYSETKRARGKIIIEL